MSNRVVLERLAADEAELIFDSFTQADAWAVGCRVRETAVANGWGICVLITAAIGTTWFHSSLPGATLDNDFWARRKTALVFRCETSSAYQEARLEGVDSARLSAMGLLNPEYAISGGGVPIRVRGAGVVACLTISGLASIDDHNAAVAALREHLGRQG